MINEKLIIIDSILNSKQEIIRNLAQKAEELGYLEDINQYINAVVQREAEFSTAIGYDVSIPHGKSSAVKEAFVCFLRTKEPVVWDNKTENAVRMVFLLGVPEDNKSTLHLKILAEISKKLMNEEFRAKIARDSKDEIIKLLVDIEDKIEK